MRRSRASRTVVAVVLCLGLFGLPAPAAHADIQTSDQAAQAIIDARTRANRAAEAWAEAEAQNEQLADELATVQGDVDTTSSRLAGLQTGVEQLALSRFTGGDSAGLSLLSGLSGPTEQVEADILAEVANNNSVSSIDEYESVRSELEAKQTVLAAKQKKVSRAQATLTAMRQQAEDDVAALKQLEDRLLHDEAVQRAVAAKQAEARRKEKEDADRRAAAEAAAAVAAAAAAKTASPNQGAAPAPSSGGSSSTGAGTGGSGTGGGAPAGGGASSDGEGGGGGSVGGCSSNCAYVDTSMICPVAGTSAFGDTWGAPRSGGRTHQGVDMLGARGTPIVAVVDGFAQQKETPLGGHSLWLLGANGNKYYYAHMDSYEKGGDVQQGDVVGYLGDTGNARGTPHLHFEVHPGGGAPVNPTPSVRAAC